ncbi:MAG: hypothetical protein ACI4SS_03185, partial [Clostridia bacterium]
MNQHSYAVRGYISKAIFCDERDIYDLCVERTCVNSAYEPNNRGRNGSIKYQIAEITENIATGEKIEPHIQVVEMGRDQPHAYGNIGALSDIAMTTLIQGTKVDPENGTVSTEEDAVNLFNFLDDRLLKGANYIARYNLGYETTYYPCYFGNFNSWNRYHKGRVDPVFGILYNYYKYTEKRDMTAEDTRYLKQIYETATSPDYSMDEFLGCATLLYSPDEAAEDYVFSKDFYYSGGEGIYEAENYTALRRGKAEIMTEDGVRFVRTTAAGEGSEIADRTFGHPYMGYSALRVRTNGKAEITVSRYDTDQPAGVFTVPDTDMRWVNVYCDFTGKATGDSTMLFYTVTGEAETVDIDYLDLSPEESAPPIPEVQSYENAVSVTDGLGRESLYLLQGENMTLTFAPQEGVSLSAKAALNKADCSGGALTYIPENVGEDELRLVYSSGEDISYRAVSIKVFPDKARLLDALIGDGLSDEDALKAEELKSKAMTADFFENARTLADELRSMRRLLCRYDFDSSSPELYGNAEIIYDEGQGSNVLYLDGTGNTFAELPQGLFDGENNLSVSMDVMLPEKIDGSYFTFTIGKDNQKYYFFRLYSDGVKSAVTKTTYYGESAAYHYQPEGYLGQWLHVDLKITPSLL